jgi:MFS family permease
VIYYRRAGLHAALRWMLNGGHHVTDAPTTMTSSSTGSTPPPTTGLRAMPGGIWALGVVSLLMDTSSELIHGLLPVFMVGVLGASVLSVGLIEGLAEATASITKIFSGTLSDLLGRRKLLVVIGYALAAVTKPLFPLAGSIGWVLAARFIDRIGKGIRGAPRDALVGEIAPMHLRGAAYGLRQSLDTVGAFLGPLAAVALMALLDDDIRAVFWLAVIPAVASVAVLIWGVREPERAAASADARPPLRLRDVLQLGAAFWTVVAIATVFTAARFSEAFLVLRAHDVGLSLALVPLILVAMNVAYAASAYPAGRLSDSMGRRAMAMLGIALLIAANLVLAFARDIWVCVAGAMLWGLHMGLTQGLFAALVADTTEPERRGTAFGAFNLVTGIATLLASLIAGLLWDLYGPPATFLAGAGFTTAALLGWVFLERRPRVA